MVSTLLQATRRPSLLAQSQLKELPFVSNEVASTEASRWATALDSAKAFNTTWSDFSAWQDMAHTFASQAPNPDHLSLREESFTEIEAWDDSTSPTELSFLARCSIADLISADRRMPDATFQPRSLARAFLLRDEFNS